MSLASSSRVGRLWAAAGLALLSFATPAHNQQVQPLRSSLLQLIANPEKYDGRLVSIVGYLTFGQEGDGLYLHKEDYENGIDADGLVVERTRQMLKDREKLYDNYVLIVGVFQRQELPAIYISTGRITDIQKCELWSRPEHPRTERLKQLETPQPNQKP
jgi:hypothetical protein